MKKERFLFGVFPVWGHFENDNSYELVKISGFWSGIAIFTNLILFFLEAFLTFKIWDEEEFFLFRYKKNGCDNWFQAVYKKFIVGFDVENKLNDDK